MFANRTQGSLLTRAQAVRLLEQLKKVTDQTPVSLGVSIDSLYHHDPYIQLISCLLSLRAKDKTTLPIALELFQRARTPQQMLALSQSELEKLIYSIGFYKQKARTVRFVSKELVARFDGRVPRTREELLSITGIGRKTANLVLGLCYGVPAVCVDVHVHRLANLLGLVRTQTPLETELALEKLLPKAWWIEVNDVLVRLGQNMTAVAPSLPPEIRQCLRPLLPKKFQA